MSANERAILLWEIFQINIPQSDRLNGNAFQIVLQDNSCRDAVYYGFVATLTASDTTRQNGIEGKLRGETLVVFYHLYIGIQRGKTFYKAVYLTCYLCRLVSERQRITYHQSVAIVYLQIFIQEIEYAGGVSTVASAPAIIPNGSVTATPTLFVP